MPEHLTKLIQGVLIRDIEKGNSEPEYASMEQVTTGLRFFQRQWEYANEINRVFSELEITSRFVEEIKESSVDKLSGVNNKDLVIYYQGIYLHLVHQMKDKILQLVNLVTEDKIPTDPTDEKDVLLKDLLSRKGDKIKKIGIEEELNKWQQGNSSAIGIVLDKRTSYHHRVSKLTQDENFSNLWIVDLMKMPSFVSALSEHGKKVIEEKIKKDSEEYYESTHTKIRSTQFVIEESIENISKALFSYMSLSLEPRNIANIVNKSMEINESFEIKNTADLNNVPKEFNDKINLVIDKMKEHKIVSVYLVGSLTRGEYEEGISDINLYVVFDDAQSDGVIERLLLGIGKEINLMLFNKKEFLSDKAKKYRFIVFSDGVLICGLDLVKKEQFPKPGTLLALVLNDDILEVLDSAESWAKENSNASEDDISEKSRFIAKRIIDFRYGVIMSNKPQFTASRKSRVEAIGNTKPESKRPSELLYKISKIGIRDWESFYNLIRGDSRKNIELNFSKMKEVEAFMQKQK